MIVPYVGRGWYLDENLNKVDCTYTKEDHMHHGVCDLCGEILCNEDDEGQSLFDSPGDVHELAHDQDWVVLGNHLVCRSCLNKIETGALDIAITKKGDQR